MSNVFEVSGAPESHIADETPARYRERHKRSARSPAG